MGRPDRPQLLFRTIAEPDGLDWSLNLESGRAECPHTISRRKFNRGIMAAGGMLLLSRHAARRRFRVAPVSQPTGGQPARQMAQRDVGCRKDRNQRPRPSPDIPRQQQARRRRSRRAQHGGKRRTGFLHPEWRLHRKPGSRVECAGRPLCISHAGPGVRSPRRRPRRLSARGNESQGHLRGSQGLLRQWNARDHLRDPPHQNGRRPARTKDSHSRRSDLHGSLESDGRRAGGGEFQQAVRDA